MLNVDTEEWSFRLFEVETGVNAVVIGARGLVDSPRRTWSYLPALASQRMAGADSVAPQRQPTIYTKAPIDKI